MTPTSSTMASLALTAASLLFVAMKNSLPWKLKIDLTTPSSRRPHFLSPAHAEAARACDTLQGMKRPKLRIGKLIRITLGGRQADHPLHPLEVRQRRAVPLHPPIERAGTVRRTIRSPGAEPRVLCPGRSRTKLAHPKTFEMCVFLPSAYRKSCRSIPCPRRIAAFQ